MAQLEARVIPARVMNPLTGPQEIAAMLTHLSFPMEAHQQALSTLGFTERPYMAATYSINVGEVRADTTLEEQAALTGISLQRFVLGERHYTVQETILYDTWNNGNYTPGAGQVGIYRVQEQVGDKQREVFMAIRDYSRGEDAEGNPQWTVSIDEVGSTEGELADRLLSRTDLTLSSVGLMQYVHTLLVENSIDPLAA